MNLGSWVSATRKDAVTLLPRGGKLTSHDPFNKRGDGMKGLYEVASVIYMLLSIVAIGARAMDAAAVFVLLAIWHQMRKDEAT